MAKKTEKKTEDVKAVPQLTFTEDEHKCLVDYMNHVSTHAKFSDVDAKQMYAISSNMVRAIGVVKKIESHIFEHRKTVQK